VGFSEVLLFIYLNSKIYGFVRVLSFDVASPAEVQKNPFEERYHLLLENIDAESPINVSFYLFYFYFYFFDLRDSIVKSSCWKQCAT